jgi:hypothetical protein
MKQGILLLLCLSFIACLSERRELPLTAQGSKNKVKSEAYAILGTNDSLLHETEKVAAKIDKKLAERERGKNKKKKYDFDERNFQDEEPCAGCTTLEELRQPDNLVYQPSGY